jgi:hypothetical protein
MRASILRLPGLLRILGFVGVVAGTIAGFVGFSEPPSAGSFWIRVLAPPLSYGLVGLAWWQWVTANGPHLPAGRTMRRPTRTLAIGFCVAGIGWLALTWGTFHFMHSLHDSVAIPHVRLHIAGYAPAAASFFLAAAGLWIASNISNHEVPDVETSETVSTAL